MHDNITVPENEKVPVEQKISYGIGGLSEFFIQSIVLALAVPIFAVGMKMDPFKLGLVLAATKVVSALADPFVGIISDKTRTRWGRRKPFIFIFGILSAVLLPFVWMVPDVSENMQFVYIFIVLSVFFFFHSLFAVPYNALGYEMTSNYDERTKVFAWKKYIGIAGGMIAGWYYAFTLLPFFGNEMVGAIHLAAIGSIVIIIGTVILTRGTREIVERVEIDEKDKISVWKALGSTFTNKSFLLVQGAIVVVVLGINIDATIGNYLHVHYTCQGSKETAAKIGGIGNIAAMIPVFIALPIGVWISTHWGKREASIFGMVVMLIGAASIPWLINPIYPKLVIIIWVLSQFGSQCSNLIYDSMMADICDEDELNTGKRREGSYAAASSFLKKIMEIFALVLSGLMPRLAGYVNTKVDPTLEQLESMKFLICITDVAGIAIAIALLYFYPLTRKKCAEIRKQLDAKKGTEENTDATQ